MLHSCDLFLRPAAREVRAGENGQVALHVDYTRTLAAVRQLSLHPRL